MADGSDRRRLILDRAAELFARQGLAATTVREIGDAVGILSGSLYHYFESKDAIAEQIMSEFIDDMLRRSEEVREAFPDDHHRALAGLFGAAFDSMADHRLACIIFYNEFRYLRDKPPFARARDKVQRLNGIWVDVLRRGMEANRFRSDVEPVLVRRFAWHAIRSAAVAMARDGSRGGEDLARGFTAIILEGIVLRSPDRVDSTEPALSPS